MSKAKEQSLLAAIDAEFAPSKQKSVKDGYPWRDRDDPFFTPLPLDRFLLDYLNIKLFPKQAEDLTTLLGEDPKQVFEPGEYQQAVLCYGKGAGKDFVVSCVMLWFCHILLCLKDPAVYLGQAPGENIDVLTVAYSQTQAKTVLFFKMKQRLKACAWFVGAIGRLVPEMSPESYLKEGNGFVGAECILFPGNIRLWSVPATDAAEGKNPIAWCADEIAAFASPVRMNQAQHIHRLLVSSARTRFQNRWKGFVISFPRHKADYLMYLVDLAAKGRSPDTYAVVRPTWEVNLNVTRESLQIDFERDPEGSECRYACNPPAAIDAYFRSPELLLLHASGAPIELLREKLDIPDRQLQIIADLGACPIREMDLAGDVILDRRGFPKLAVWFRGQKNAAGEPYEYFCHLDPGLSGDSFGLAIGHIHQLPEGGILPVLDLAFRWTGRMFRDFGEIFRQQWFPDSPEQTETVTAAEIDFRTVREFLFYLRERRGFNIVQVSMDSWNSAESRQELEKRDFQCVLRVVNKEDYDEFKSLVYNRQMQYYAYPVLIRECYKLEIVSGTKVDARRSKEGEGIGNDSHKDVSDAAAAVARYLSFFKGDAIEFAQLASVEEIAEQQRTAEQQKDPMPAIGSELNEEQRELLDRFFGG